MAQFKPYKISSSQLDSLPRVEGQMILTIDDGRLYFDVSADKRVEIGGASGLSIPVNPTDTTNLNLWIETSEEETVTISITDFTLNEVMEREIRIKTLAVSQEEGIAKYILYYATDASNQSIRDDSSFTKLQEYTSLPAQNTLIGSVQSTTGDPDKGYLTGKCEILDSEGKILDTKYFDNGYYDVSKVTSQPPVPGMV